MFSFSKSNWCPEAVKFSGLCLFTWGGHTIKLSYIILPDSFFNIQFLFRLFSSKIHHNITSLPELNTVNHTTSSSRETGHYKCKPSNAATESITEPRNNCFKEPTPSSELLNMSSCITRIIYPEISERKGQLDQ